MKFEEALKCMREGKKVTDGRYTYKIEYGYLNRKANDDNTWFTGCFEINVVSDKWEVVDDNK